jgi:hypothetical protein
MDQPLYEVDFYAWTRRQAAALRDLAARPSGGSNAVDWPHVIEEVEALGRSEVSAVRSALLRLMEHAALVALARPDHQDRSHWMGEMRIFRDAAADGYRPSMRQALTPKLDRAWDTAREAAARKLGRDPEALPKARPFTLPELLHAVPLDGLVDVLSRDLPS